MAIEASSLAISSCSSRTCDTSGEGELARELVRVLVVEIELPDERAHEVGTGKPAELLAIARLPERRLSVDDESQSRHRLESEAARRLLDPDDDIAERRERPRGKRVDGFRQDGVVLGAAERRHAEETTPHLPHPASGRDRSTCELSGRTDLNCRPLRPKRSALPS